MSILLFIIILLVLVLVHEAGHFFTAKYFGIRVDEFGFGFPPKLFGIKRGETEYTFNLLPIGGFVKIFGENNEGLDQSDPDHNRSFVMKAKWQQAIVLVAGVVMNFALAWVLFSVGLMTGLPTSVGSEPGGSKLSDVHVVIIAVMPDSPAQAAGLIAGDTIVSLSNQSKLNPTTIREIISQNPDQEIELSYMRGKSLNVLTTKVKPEIKSGVPLIGISMDEVGTAQFGFLGSFYYGFKVAVSVTKSTAVGLYMLIRDALLGQGSLDAVTGPVGMVGIVGQAYKFGFSYLLSFAALISINLAIINLLPFPALDGGRLFFLLIEKIKGSAISPKFANAANLVGFSILILLMITITYHDVAKLL